MNVATGPWLDNFRAVFGDLSNQRATSFENFVQANVNHYRQGELDHAIASICSSWGKEGKPGAKDVIARIYWLRERPNGVLNDSKRADLARRMRRIEQADTDADIWEIICEPNDNAECEALEAHALKCFHDFKRPNFNWDLKCDDIAKEMRVTK